MATTTKGMTLREAAAKWGKSPAWVRRLIKRGTVKAELRKDTPIPYYVVLDLDYPELTNGRPPKKVKRAMKKVAKRGRGK